MRGCPPLSPQDLPRPPFTPSRTTPTPPPPRDPCPQKAWKTAPPPSARCVRMPAPRGRLAELQLPRANHRSTHTSRHLSSPGAPPGSRQERSFRDVAPSGPLEEGEGDCVKGIPVPILLVSDEARAGYTTERNYPIGNQRAFQLALNLPSGSVEAHGERGRWIGPARRSPSSIMRSRILNIPFPEPPKLKKMMTPTLSRSRKPM